MIDKTRVSIPCQHFHTWDHNSWKVSSEACCQWSDKGQTFSTVSYSFGHTKDKLVLPFHTLSYLGYDELEVSSGQMKEEGHIFQWFHT